MVAYGHGRVIRATRRRTPSACGSVHLYAIQLGRMHKESAMKLHGGHVVVIGGSSGIGLATARLAREEGAEVTIAGRSQEILV
jgi:NADPH:quinone reductase-like Zn-dependent oxidoreductase